MNNRSYNDALDRRYMQKLKESFFNRNYFNLCFHETASFSDYSKILKHLSISITIILCGLIKLLQPQDLNVNSLKMKLRSV